MNKILQQYTHLPFALLCIAFSILTYRVSIAQTTADTSNFSMKGSKMFIESGTQLYIDGTLNNIHNDYIYDATPDGQINNGDTIFLAGNIANMINNPLFLTGGNMYLRYDFPQLFKNQQLTLFNLIINKSGNDLFLQRDIELTNKLLLIKGNLNFVNYTLDLTNTGFVTGETETRRILGNKGSMIARNRLLSPGNSGDIGTMGISLSPLSDNLGLTTLTRKHGIQDNAANGSINRYYDLVPSSTGTVNVQFNYFDADLSGVPGNLNKLRFSLWKSAQTGVEESDHFDLHPGTSDPSLNKVSGSNLNLESSGVRITIADSVCLNPPHIGLPTAPVGFCAGDSITLDADTNGVSYLWTPGGFTTQTITLDSSEISGNSDTLTVSVIGSNGCKNNASVIVNVYSVPEANFTTAGGGYCSEIEVPYNNTSAITPSQTLTYLWTFNDASTSTNERPSKTYNTPGTISTTLRATSEFACTDTITKNTIIKPIPNADFSISSTTICAGSSIDLTNNATISSGAIASSNWNFGDGFSSQLSALDALNTEMKVYATAGLYNIILQVASSGGCSNSISRQVSVKTVPIANYSASGFQTGLTTSFDNTSSISDGSSLIYSWDFGDASISTDREPFHTYGTSGTYSLTLVVTSPNDCSDTIQGNISISSIPLAGYTFSSSNYCSGATVSFNDTSSIPGGGTLSYLWDFGDGNTSTNQHPAKQYTSPGTYIVKLTVSSLAGLTSVASKNVTIYPIPKALFSAAQVCIGTSTSFINSSTIASGTNSYSWNFGDASSANTNTSPTYTYSTSGTYSVSLIASSNNGCKDTSGNIIIVNPMPASDFSAPNQCKGTLVSFTNTSSLSYGKLSYNWNFGNGNTSANVTPLQTYNLNGTYRVVLKAISDAGCQHTTTKTLTIYELPVANFSSTLSCQGDTTYFANSSSISDGNLSFTWNFGTGLNSTQSSPKVSFANANTYNVQLTATSNNACIATKSKLINVYPIPIPDFTFTNVCTGTEADFSNTSSIFAVGADAMMEYQWQFDDGASSIMESPSHQYAVAGEYDVVLKATSVYGCESSDTNTITIYPNPIASFNVQNSCKTDTVDFINTSTVAGENQTYSWNFNDGTTSQDISPEKVFNVVKTHYVTLLTTSEFGCINSITKPVTIFAKPLVNVVIPDSTCVNSQILLTNTSSISNGTFSYLWDFGDGAQYSIKTPAHTYASPGLYYIQLTLTSNNNCVASYSKQIKVNPTPIVDFSYEGIIYSKSTSFTNLSRISDGSTLSYNWNFGDGAGSALENPQHIYFTDATYSVNITVNSSNGCSGTSSKNVIINAPPPPDFSCDNASKPLVSLGNDTAICQGASLSLNAQNPGAVYRWSNGSTSQSIEVSLAGLYSLIVINDEGCAGSDNILITTLSSLIVNLGIDKIICDYDAPVVLDAQNSGSSFRWSDGSTNQTLSVHQSGTYSVTAINSFNCSSTDIIQITVNPSPVPPLGKDTSFCDGNSIDLNAQNNGSSYLWSNGATSQSINVSQTGIYNVNISNQYACVSTDEIALAKSILPPVNLGNDRSICQGVQLILNAGNSGSSYIWSNEQTSQLITVTTSNNYSVTVTDINGCSKSDQVNIVINPIPTRELSDDMESCSGILLNAGNDGSSYLWSTNQTSQIIFANNSGTYIITVKNQYNCLNKDTVTFTLNSMPVLEIGNDTAICQGEKLILNAANPGSSYIWSDNTFDRLLSVKTTGTYFVKVIDEHGCINQDTINIKVNPIPLFSLGNDKDACSGTGISIIPNLSAGNYLWSNGSSESSLNLFQGGLYWLKQTNFHGCVNSDTVKLTYHDYPTVDLGRDTSVCSRIILDAGSGLSYNWSNQVTTQTLLVTNSGTYLVNVSNTYNCSKVDTINIIIVPGPFVDLGPDVNACDGEILTLSASTNAENFSWSTHSNNDSIPVTSSGLYILKASNENGCQSIDSIKIKFNPYPTMNLKDAYPLCANEPVSLSAGNSNSVYLWKSDKGFLSTHKDVSITQEGLYWVNVTNQFNCNVSDTFRVNKTTSAVYAKFVMPSEVNEGDSTRFINLSYPKPYTSHWSFGDGLSSIDEDPLHIYFMNGDIPVTLTISNDICADKVTKSLKSFAKTSLQIDTTGKKVQYIIDAVVFPNPNTGRFMLETRLAVETDIYIDFFDLTGRLIFFKELSGQQLYHNVFDYENLDKGIYIVRLIVKNEKKIFKVVIN